MTLPLFRRPRSLFTNNWWHLGVCGYAGENEKQAERYIRWIYQKISMSKVYNSYPKCFDFTIKSIARRNTFNTIFSLNLEIWPFTKLYLSSINTWHFISDQNFTCWGKNGASFWNITKTFWPKKYLTLNQSDAMKIRCKCTLARVVGEDKNSIHIASDAIDICFKFRNTN